MRLIKTAFLISSIAVISSPVHAMDGDVEAGEKVFRKCMACHVLDSNDNKVGPSLQNVVGRQPGVVEDFKYSKAMVEFGEGKVWDEALLNDYLANPRAVVKGTRMAFAGLKKEDELVNVIAYIKTFSEAAEETEVKSE